MNGFFKRMAPRPLAPRAQAQVYELSLADWDKLKRFIDTFANASVKGAGIPEAIADLNKAWKQIGDRVGFDWRSARRAPGQSTRYVLAFPRRPLP